MCPNIRIFYLFIPHISFLLFSLHRRPTPYHKMNTLTFFMPNTHNSPPPPILKIKKYKIKVQNVVQFTVSPTKHCDFFLPKQSILENSATRKGQNHQTKMYSSPISHFPIHGCNPSFHTKENPFTENKSHLIQRFNC